MQTRRDYLVSKGLAKAGRGKFSGAALAELDNARKAGIKFSDDQNSVPARQAAKIPGKPEPVVKSDPRDTPYLTPDEYRYPEAEYKALVGKKEVSLRECCNTCKVSLVNHACNAPTIHNAQPVKIERR